MRGQGAVGDEARARKYTEPFWDTPGARAGRADAHVRHEGHCHAGRDADGFLWDSQIVFDAESINRIPICSTPIELRIKILAYLYLVTKLHVVP